MSTHYTFEATTAARLSERVFKTPIDGIFFVQHQRFDDNRGFYKEVTLVPDLDQHLSAPFQTKQINQARSFSNVVRGMHAENWNKLITVTSGVCFCALADIRTESPTFGDVLLIELGISDSNTVQSGSLFLPRGIANSLCVTQGPVDYMYVVDQLYRERDTQGDLSISVFDLDLSIPWPIAREKMVISQRDTQTVTLREKFPEKF